MIIKGWFLHKIDYSDAPENLAELASRFKPTLIEAKSLIAASKWEPFIQGKLVEQRLGWVPLGELASTRRGIATGANEFFLLNEEKAKQLGLSETSLVPCVGRANNVQGLVFTETDYAILKAKGVKCLLLDIKGDPTGAELAYIAWGQESGLTERYILTNRSPWYSMEQREPAPIWASVFGRGDLEFVHNAALVKSLTNFHCVYPVRGDPVFVRALTMTLNSREVRHGSRLHTRGYGGGLTKFEPNDLKEILVPDLRAVSDNTLKGLSTLLDQADVLARQDLDDENFQDSVSDIIGTAGQEASP